MPITVHPSETPLETFDSRYPTPQPASFYINNPFDIVNSNDPLQKRKGEVLQCSFPVPPNGSSEKDLVLPAWNSNGFVDTALQAYNHHHHLVLRPDDIWTSILSQFNLYINANAETMRHHFVAHQGQRGLEIKAAGTRYSYNFGDLATQMGELIQKNVVDPELRKWIIPDFTTTTADDIIISSVIMMSTLQKYFNYKCCLLCGLPAVTLLGEKSDWENILQRTEKLVKYGEVAIHWHNLLKPVLTGLINTFSNPDSEDTKNFWQSIAHCQGGGSGPTYLSGWITAFCFFDSHGASLYDKSHIRRVHDDTLLKLGNATFHVVDTDDIPPAYAAVPVLLDDNGVKVKTVMVAGLLGTRVTGNKGTVQPQAAWWIAEDLSEKET